MGQEAQLRADDSQGRGDEELEPALPDQREAKPGGGHQHHKARENGDVEALAAFQ